METTAQAWDRTRTGKERFDGQVESVQVGLQRDIWWRGRQLRTSIFKNPVRGRVIANANGLTGDQGCDLGISVNPDKAIFAYFAEHYRFWRQELDSADLPYGAFGENLTVSSE
jgi:MOSC domain-containing protein YiiM